jgi:hypothetical protein
VFHGLKGIKLGCEKKELAAAGCRKAEINNTVSCK